MFYVQIPVTIKYITHTDDKVCEINSPVFVSQIYADENNCEFTSWYFSPFKMYQYVTKNQQECLSRLLNNEKLQPHNCVELNHSPAYTILSVTPKMDANIEEYREKLHL